MPDGLSRDKIDTINELVRSEQYDAARALLVKWDAKESLARLNARLAAKPVKTPLPHQQPIPHEPDPPAPPPLTLYQQFRIPLLIFLALFVLAGVLMIMQQYQQQYEAAQRMFGR